MPSGFHTALSYDRTHAYLNLALNFVPPPGTGLTGNQQGVGNAISKFFNNNGSIPILFGGLTPAGLTQLSGESAIGSQQSTFSAMNQFMNVMTDPFVAGRGDPIGAGGVPNAYAEESLAYAAKGKGRSASERNAYAAMYNKAGVAPTFEQRWSVWAAGFGGTQTTTAMRWSVRTTPAAASMAPPSVRIIAFRRTPSRALRWPVAARISTSTVSAMAGPTCSRPAPSSGTISGRPMSRVRSPMAGRTSRPTAPSRSPASIIFAPRSRPTPGPARLESGYRFVAPIFGGLGITPYAAGQFTTVDLPAYAEGVFSGSPLFALSYAGKSVTDTRSELGFRTDKSFAVQNGILTLRGRFAWAHDFDPDRSIATTFQALPGASFVVNGAAQASNAALTTASAEWKWTNGWSAAATFEGEFSNVTESYAAKGVVRYAW